MKKAFLVVALLMSVVASTADCSSAWWKDIKSDPITYVTRFEQQSLNFLNTALTIYQTIKPLLPGDKTPAIDKTFQTVTLGVQHALAALNDGLQAAQEARQDKPDLGKLIANVVAAVDEVVKFLDELKQKYPVASGSTEVGSGVELLTRQQTALHAYH